MSDQGKTAITYIAREMASASHVCALLHADPAFDVREQAGALSEINGKAVEFAKGSEIVVFETSETPAQDVAAIQDLKQNLPDNVSLVAIASAAASLADVRLLTGAGVDDVIPDTIDPIELTEQLAIWLEKQRSEAVAAVTGSAFDGKVIAVTRSRGGIGGTTVAVNVADALLDRQGTFRKKIRNRVALLDFDLQFGSVASLLDIEASDAFYQMLLDGTEPDETFVDQLLIKHHSGISVLPAPSNFVPLDALSAVQVARLIDIVRATHDFVVIDLPRALLDWFSPVLERTDKLLIVTDSSVPSVRQSKRLIDFFVSDNLSLEVQIVINHEKKPVIPRRHHSEASKVLERDFRHWLPFDPKSAREACDRGVPMSEAAAQSGLTKSLSRLGRALMKEELEAKPGQQTANS